MEVDWGRQPLMAYLDVITLIMQKHYRNQSRDWGSGISTMFNNLVETSPSPPASTNQPMSFRYVIKGHLPPLPFSNEIEKPLLLCILSMGKPCRNLPAPTTRRILTILLL
ncbi:hypothetical protein AVEN_20826-1 [Araneus ventricosus]|uniref:Uncharacterized protein n=1 Tax=Araneus ventricosus TaxID=182803 RepID=A0A4Y2LCX6_ARAVE|nr:hypothetical protein AVEN_7664-1 [Araneus ventricosus]GBN12554.1 hypothetical protein AVEN_20826-1 [Araneus ventricosus]